MRRYTALMMITAVAALLVAVAGCDSSNSAATDNGDSDATTASSSGIWVTGQASVNVEPDLVLLTVGVETYGQDRG